VACALAPSLPALLVFRLFAGLAGSCPLALSAGTIADIVPYEKRGIVTAVWSVGPLLGPVVGPIGMCLDVTTTAYPILTRDTPRWGVSHPGKRLEVVILACDHSGMSSSVIVDSGP
jgi:MFS family permease